MGVHILLTGAPGSGKTTLIRRVLEQLPVEAGGFYTREIRKEGRRQGFELVRLDGETAVLAHVDFKSAKRISKYGVHSEVVDQLGIPALRKAANAGWITVIDEIGPMEIFSEAFRQAVLDILQSDATILGSIVQRSTPFTDQVKHLPELTLLEVNRDNRDQLVKEIIARLRRKDA